MPGPGSKLVSVRIKLALCFAICCFVVPYQIDNSFSFSDVGVVGLVIAAMYELLLGALLGLSVSLMLAAGHVVGSLIAGLSGFSLGALGGGAEQEKGDPVSQLFWWTTLAVFIAMGGIGQVVEALLQSFQVIAPGTAQMNDSFLQFLTNTLSQAFQFGLSVSIPAIAALLVASAALGMVQRNFPQLGGLQVGLNLKSIVGMLITSITLVSAPMALQSGLQANFEQWWNWLDLMAG